MIAQKRAALRGGGGYESATSRSYPVARPPSSRIGARLSPRRKLYAQRLLDYLNRDRHRWQNGEIRLTDDTYSRLHDPSAFDVFAGEGLDRFAVNQAVDDLFALGLVDVRMAGGVQVVTALADQVEGAA